MSNYISKKFANGAEFDEWAENNTFNNCTLLKELSEQDLESWNNKACNLRIVNGKLQLLCEDGNVLAEGDLCCLADNASLGAKDGTLVVQGIREANAGKIISIWVGTQAQYDAILVPPDNTFFWITDESTMTDFASQLLALQGRMTKVEGDLTTEANTRQSADNTLQANIGLEETARRNADNTLQANIDAEASARQSADKDLREYIDTEVESVDDRVADVIDGTTPVEKSKSAEKLTTEGKLVGVNAVFDHEVKQQFPSNLLSITTNALAGLTTFNSSGDKLTEAGIYLIQGYEKLSGGTHNFVCTMMLAWDGAHVGISSVGVLPKQLVTTAKMIYIAAGTDGTLSCYLWDEDTTPIGSNSIIDDYEFVFRLYKIGETALLV